MGCLKNGHYLIDQRLVRQKAAANGLRRYCRTCKLTCRRLSVGAAYDEGAVLLQCDNPKHIDQV